MKVLIVYAHPEPRSLTGALKDFAVAHLATRGHQVQVSDLYAMRWKASADGEDFPTREASARLAYTEASGEAFARSTQLPEVAAEQAKLLWADAIVFQFPLWWFSLPAILKGWVDRVFAHRFAYGVGEYRANHWGDRYGEGTLAGRRALLALTIGGRAAHYAERGVNGALDDVLFPIHHGMLFYPGLTVLPPFATYQTDRRTLAEFPALASAYAARLDGLFTDAPIPFRPQNGGDYDTQQQLKPGLGGNQTGLRLHLSGGDVTDAER